jgi:hypothetical protein
MARALAVSEPEDGIGDAIPRSVSGMRETGHINECAVSEPFTACAAPMMVASAF